MSEAPIPWPPGVKPISANDLNRLGIDKLNQLFWDGSRIEIRRRLDLTRLQKVAAVLVTVAAIAGGLGALASGVQDGSAFLCARNLHWLSCPLPR